MVLHTEGRVSDAWRQRIHRRIHRQDSEHKAQPISVVGYGLWSRDTAGLDPAIAACGISKRRGRALRRCPVHCDIRNLRHRPGSRGYRDDVLAVWAGRSDAAHSGGRARLHGHGHNDGPGTRKANHPSRPTCTAGIAQPVYTGRACAADPILVPYDGGRRGHWSVYPVPALFGPVPAGHVRILRDIPLSVGILQRRVRPVRNGNRAFHQPYRLAV